MTALGVRGVVEGFYGRPWSWQERERLVGFLARHGFNAYAYAPKDDPLHRDRWREPYRPSDWRRFASLARACARSGVEFCFGVSPLGLRASDDHDVARLLAKLGAADDAGVRRFCLLTDDMPDAFATSADARRFPTLAAAHASVVERVRGALAQRGADRRLWFVPLHYHGDPAASYVREIGERISPDVDICWTGPDVCSQRLTLAHTRAVSASLRRPVLYWDNHPVNDGCMRDDPHLGPLRGREAGLGSAASGILANLALQPEASRIALSTIGEYAADPDGYDPEAAWRRALLAVTGDEDDAAAVAVLADLARRSPLQPGDELANALAEPLEAFGRTWETSPDRRRDAVRHVAAVLDGLAATAARLCSSLGNQRLRADLAPWSRKLARQVAGARGAVRVLAIALDDPAALRLPALRRQVLRQLCAARETSAWVAGGQLEEFSRACLHRADDLVPRPPAAPTAGHPPPR